MEENKTTQQKAADAILQRKRAIVLGDETIIVAPPTIGTLVIVSEYISQIPEFNEDKKEYVFEVLAKAKDCKPLVYAIAALILGAKRWDEEMDNPKAKRRLWGQKTAKVKVRDYYAERILNELAPSQLTDAVSVLLNGLEIADFFGTIIFLNGANVTKRTRKMIGATPSGQSSQASSSPSM